MHLFFRKDVAKGLISTCCFIVFQKDIVSRNNVAIVVLERHIWTPFEGKHCDENAN